MICSVLFPGLYYIIQIGVALGNAHWACMLAIKGNCLCLSQVSQSRLKSNDQINVSIYVCIVHMAQMRGEGGEGVAGHKSFEHTAFLALLGVTKPQAFKLKSRIMLV